MKTQQKHAQIMLLTLLVLTILAIAIVSILTILIQDTEQTTTSRAYQELLNVSETSVQQVVELYGEQAQSNDLSGLLGESGAGVHEAIQDTFSVCAQKAITQTDSTYECRSPADAAISTILEATDSKDIDTFPLAINTPLTLNLEGYSRFEGLELQWDRDDISLEILVFFENATGEKRSITDLWDVSTVNITEPSPSSQVHALSFEEITPEINQQSTRIRDFAVINEYNPVAIVITPRTKDTAIREINLSILPTDYTTYPFQMRTIHATSFNPNDAATPSIPVETQIPLTPQIDPIFFYSLLTPDTIEIE